MEQPHFSGNPMPKASSAPLGGDSPNRSLAMRDLLRQQMEEARRQLADSGYCPSTLDYMFSYLERELGRESAGVSRTVQDVSLLPVVRPVAEITCRESLDEHARSSSTADAATRTNSPHPGFQQPQTGSMTGDKVCSCRSVRPVSGFPPLSSTDRKTND